MIKALQPKHIGREGGNIALAKKAVSTKNPLHEWFLNFLLDIRENFCYNRKIEEK